MGHLQIIATRSTGALQHAREARRRIKNHSSRFADVLMMRWLLRQDVL
jgi:hypothetical protein